MTTHPRKATDPPQSVSEWVTRTEAALILRISPHTFDRYRREGRIERFITPGRHPRYRRGDVLALLSESAPPVIELDEEAAG
jgi:hypothetical protein